MRQLQRAVFFDRDGVLNIDTGYLYKKEEFQWVEGAIEAIRCCNEHGYLTFVITNQGGIARGYYGEADVQALHGWMNEELAKHGARIDAFFYCPHHIDGSVAGYSYQCDCRKPSPAMIERAMAAYPVEREGSFMIGDKDTDLACAASAGIDGIKFVRGNLYDVVRARLGKG